MKNVGWEFELATVHQRIAQFLWKMEFLTLWEIEKYYKYFEKVGKNS